MKKLFTGFILISVLFLSGCSKHKGVIQEVDGTTEDFQVTFLFECDGVKIYRFRDCYDYRYFAVGDGNIMTRHKRIGKRKLVRFDDSVIQAR